MAPLHRSNRPIRLAKLDWDALSPPTARESSCHRRPAVSGLSSPVVECTPDWIDPRSEGQDKAVVLLLVQDGIPLLKKASM